MWADRTVSCGDPWPEPHEGPVPRRLIDADELRKLLTADFDKVDPARVRGRERTALQGARPDARGRRSPQADPRSPEWRRRRLLSQRRGMPVRDLEERPARRQREGSRSPTSTTTRSRTRTSRSSRDQKDVLDQSDRFLARQAVYEGDATLLMTHWASTNLTPPSCSSSSRAAPTPRQQALLDEMPGDPEGDPALPVHDRAASSRASRPRAAGRPSTTSTTGCPSRPSRSSTRRSTRPTRRPSP